MAHELATHANGQTMMAYRGESPWHGLGTKVPDGLTGMEFLKAANLNWTAKTTDTVINAIVDDGEEATGWDDDKDCAVITPKTKTIQVPVPNMKVVYRSDTGAVLGNVSDGFSLFQNGDVAELMDSLAVGGEIKYETAGAIKNGAIVWMLAKIPELAFSIKGDEINSFMLVQNGHTGKSKLKAIPTTVRVVCANTLKAANSTYAAARSKEKVNTVNQGYEIKHTKNMVNRVDAVKAAYKAHIEDFRLTKEMFEVLAGIPVTSKNKAEFFRWMVEGDSKDESATVEKTKSKREATLQANILDKLEKLYVSPTNQTGTKDTLFALLNVGTEYVDHERTTRVTDDNMTDAQARFTSANFGQGDAFKAEILDKVLELAGV